MAFREQWVVFLSSLHGLLYPLWNHLNQMSQTISPSLRWPLCPYPLVSKHLVVTKHLPCAFGLSNIFVPCIHFRVCILYLCLLSVSWITSLLSQASLTALPLVPPSTFSSLYYSILVNIKQPNFIWDWNSFGIDIMGFWRGRTFWDAIGVVKRQTSMLPNAIINPSMVGIPSLCKLAFQTFSPVEWTIN